MILWKLCGDMTIASDERARIGAPATIVGAQDFI
jgi:hypothetical protein